LNRLSRGAKVSGVVLEPLYTEITVLLISTVLVELAHSPWSDGSTSTPGNPPPWGCVMPWSYALNPEVETSPLEAPTTGEPVTVGYETLDG
jgi:hypothetical protein